MLVWLFYILLISFSYVAKFEIYTQQDLMFAFLWTNWNFFVRYLLIFVLISFHH